MAASITPQAFANLSPWLERSDNHGLTHKQNFNAESVRQSPNPFRVDTAID
jgi:hypothetical protein